MRALDIYKIESNTLTFGKDAKTAETLAEADRPTALDPLRVFARK